MPTPDRQTLAKQLAETYTGGYYEDPWAVVQEYQAYLEQTADNPDAGSQRIATKLEIPRGRIREWMDGSKPDHVRAIEVADQSGWLDLDWETDTAQALNCLVAWIFAGGSLTEDSYIPHLTVTDSTIDCGKRLLSVATGEQPRVRQRDGNRPTELLPRRNQTAFGRLLFVLGAPTSYKNDKRSDLTLPAYLADTPEHVRTDFARTYLWNRGSELDHTEGLPIQVTEKRSQQYQDELRDLLNSLVYPAVTGSQHTFRITKAAADDLYQPPSLCSARQDSD